MHTARCAALFSLSLSELNAIAASCAQIKMKGMRAAQATKVSSLIAKVRGLLAPLKTRGVQVQPSEHELLEQLNAQINTLMPTQAADDSDDEYY